MNSSSPERSSVRSLWLFLSIALCVIVVPLMLKAAAPGWWTSGVIDPSLSANDYAAVNQGQVKNMAQRAMQEMDAHLPGGAGDAVHTVVDAWDVPTGVTH